MVVSSDNSQPPPEPPMSSGLPGENTVTLPGKPFGVRRGGHAGGGDIEGGVPAEGALSVRNDPRWLALKGASVLIVDDDVSLGRVLQRLFVLTGALVKTASNGISGLQILATSSVDVVLLDISLPDTNGLDLLDQIKKANTDCEVVMITGHADTKNVVTAIRKGAYDFLTKPFEPKEVLLATALKAVEHRRRLRAHALPTPSEGDDPFQRLVGVSDAMRRTREAAVTVAPTRVAVLVLG